MKIFLFCLAMFFNLNSAITLKRETIKNKQRRLGGGFEDMLAQMSLEHSSSEDKKLGTEEHIVDLMYGGTRFQNRLLTKKIVYQKLNIYYEKIEFWLHTIIKKMNSIKRKADKKISQMAIGIERRNMLLQKYIQQKEQAAKVINERLEEIHKKREALRKKLQGAGL